MEARNAPHNAVVFVQQLCEKHKSLHATKGDHERPERLRAVRYGIGAIYARLETPDLPEPFLIVRSKAYIDDISTCAAARAVVEVKDEHEDSRRPTYAQKLLTWCSESKQRISDGLRELPSEFEGDLYVCPESYKAFSGALATVCEAVDVVAAASLSTSLVGVASRSESPLGTRAFVAVRPPGHHCVSDRPAGVGFVNNVCVGVAHAHMKHRYNRVVILDIDLHHGNGTQRIVQELNRNTHEGHQDLLVYYGSIHNLAKYPCKDDVISAEYGQLSVHGVDGQWVENVPMQHWSTEADYWDLYNTQYSKILTTAVQFLEQTHAEPSKTIFFISCGFSASSLEHKSVTGACTVPPSFFHSFTRQACSLADKHAQGRLVSVLEGGYSDRALVSGTMAHVAALASADVNAEWWSTANFSKLEKMSILRQGGWPSKASLPPWVQRAHQLARELYKPGRNYPPGRPTPMNVPVPDIQPPKERQGPRRRGGTSSDSSEDGTDAERSASGASTDDEAENETGLWQRTSDRLREKNSAVAGRAPGADANVEEDDDEDEEDELEDENEGEPSLPRRGRPPGRGTRGRGGRGSRGRTSTGLTRGGRRGGGRGRGSRRGRPRGRGRGTRGSLRSAGSTRRRAREETPSSSSSEDETERTAYSAGNQNSTVSPLTSAPSGSRVASKGRDPSASTSAPAKRGAPSSSIERAPQAKRSRTGGDAMQHVVSKLLDAWRKFAQDVDQVREDMLPPGIQQTVRTVNGLVSKLERNVENASLVEMTLQLLEDVTDKGFEMSAKIEDKELAKCVMLGMAAIDGAASAVRGAM